MNGARNAVAGERAETFVVWSLRAMAAGFVLVGMLFITTPDGVLNTISDLGDEIGDFPRAPATEENLWLALAFAYMVVITGIALVTQIDVVRYRLLLLVLAAGKAASSLASLGYFVFDDDVFIYLLNFLVDGFLVGASLLLWVIAARIQVPPTPP